MECSVCTEPFNKSSRNPIKCTTCDYKVCSGCTEAYLLQTSEDAHCMNCRVGWTRETLHGCGLTLKFVRNTYKKRREDILYEREKGMMPATQPHVEREILIRQYNKRYDDIQKSHVILANDRFRVNNYSLEEIAAQSGLADYTECSLWRIDKYYQISENIAKITNEQACLQAKVNFLRTSSVDVKKEARKFIRACPNNDCKGFLSHVWKCGVCEHWSCPDCHEVKGPDKDSPHTCDPNTLASARLLSADSKPCPKCAALIFKIEGCDQMWCTQCTTAFSWRTGRIEVGRIHNPHYYEYRRTNGTVPREIGDIPCGGMPTDRQVFDVVKKFEKGQSTSILYNIVRFHWHLANVVMPTYTVTRDNNLDLRIKYMLKDIDTETFKLKIQQREKANSKKTEILNILNMYQLISAETMQRVVAACNISEYTSTAQEFEGIREYTNELLRKVSQVYTCTTPRISEFYSVRPSAV